MALDAHITVKGAVQGDFPGTSNKAGRETTMECWAFSHDLKSPYDKASGSPSGRRQHKPLTITKAVDKASPYFVQALCTNENLPEVKIRFYHPNPNTGNEVNFYTVTLEQANISEIRTEMLNNKYEDNKEHELREHISFTYEKITWTNNEGKTQAADDWSAPDLE